MKYTYDYGQSSGYDCMTGAYMLRLDGKLIATFDLSDFGQENCGDDFEARKLADPLVKEIVDKLNKEAA